jgi:hypothetical protein
VFPILASCRLNGACGFDRFVLPHQLKRSPRVAHCMQEHFKRHFRIWTQALDCSRLCIRRLRLCAVDLLSDRKHSPRIRFQRKHHLLNISKRKMPRNDGRRFRLAFPDRESGRSQSITENRRAFVGCEDLRQRCTLRNEMQARVFHRPAPSDRVYLARAFGKLVRGRMRPVRLKDVRTQRIEDNPPAKRKMRPKVHV